MNYPVPVLGYKSKINQNRSIFQMVRGNPEIWDAEQNTYELLFYGLVSMNLLT